MIIFTPNTVIKSTEINSNFAEYTDFANNLGQWASWTPTWSGVSGGTNNFARYVQVGKLVTFRIQYTLAGAGVSGNTAFSLPVTASSNQAGDLAVAGTGAYLDAANNIYFAILNVATTTVMTIRPLVVNATYGTYGGAASATAPFTFGNADTITAAGTYEAA